ncbi:MULTISPECIES: hypothetical protein [unclassified Rhizobium]|nr:MULTISPECIES: hypothetical protein [unclassified Rhizobium]
MTLPLIGVVNGTSGAFMTARLDVKVKKGGNADETNTVPMTPSTA